ncbi:hypothetical protein MLD38_014026 [Melastoma candidum]|uniref:Uncharacterized protein n=1 Tax=Melastoma candidum TaxID=119954 RepID=A0ACB9RDA5_9MYRT|nr:hypothetical protein MLD38_014026 [Melastoma candidum]
MYGGPGHFDGAAAFSGGGFMPSQSTQSADPSSFSPAKNRDSQSLLPVTVKQINASLVSNDDKINVLIDGVDVSTVTLLGKVCNKAERVTDVTFSLDDGTGRIDCNKWINEALDTSEMEGILDGMYVRVHGHLKNFQGKKQLNVFSIRPVSDFDEIPHHFVECIYVHMYNTRLKHNSQSGGANTQTQMTNPVMSNSYNGYSAPMPNQFGGQHGSHGLAPVAQMVLDCLQQPQYLMVMKGAHISEVAQQIGLSVDKTREAISSLVEEGLVYSTIDDFHFKSTGNA